MNEEQTNKFLVSSQYARQFEIPVLRGETNETENGA